MVKSKDASFQNPKMNPGLNKNTKILLVILLLADLGFIILHIAYKMDLTSNPLLTVEKDGGYAEIFQYLKEFWIITVLVILFFREKHKIYLAWTLLFTYLLLDDSLKVHENLGAVLASNIGFQPALGLAPHDYGEVLVSAIFGIFLFSIIGFAYWGSEGPVRCVSKRLFFLILALLFFGVLIDLAHAIVPARWARGLMGLIEDGGEMMVMSVIVTYISTLLPGQIKHQELVDSKPPQF